MPPPSGHGRYGTLSRAITVASLVQVGLSGALTLGWVGLPALGVIGPAGAMIVCQGSAAFYMVWHLQAVPGYDYTAAN